MRIRIDHLLIRHDVLHDQVLVLFSNGLIKFLLILTDQLLDVHVVLLLLQLLSGSTGFIVHDGLVLLRRSARRLRNGGSQDWRGHRRQGCLGGRLRLLEV